MNRALNQIIDRQILNNEVNQIIIDQNVDYNDIDFCYVIESDPNGDYILKGFYEIRINGNYRRNLFKSSSAILNDTGFYLVNPTIIKSIYFLKHNDFIDILQSTENSVLRPRIVNQNSQPFPYELKILFYRLSTVSNPVASDFDENSALLVGQRNLFPSPPATGTNQ